jgi:tRNA (guanine-N7-)-methyltransferase
MIQGFIKNNGYLFISTDWDNYAESIKEVLDRSVFFMSSNNASLEKNSLTKFEQRGVDEGRDIHEFNYRKK